MSMQTNETLRAYNEYANVYDAEVIEFWEQFPRTFIDAFSNTLPQGGRILNVGSGSGRDALLLRDLGFEVICVDASSAMIELTRKLGFESYLQTFEQMDFPEGSFDGAWAYTSLIHVPPQQAQHATAKIHSFLKPRAPFAIGVITGDNDKMVERSTMPGVQRYFKFYSSEELKTLIEPVGFQFMSEETYQPHNSVYLNQLYRKKS